MGIKIFIDQEKGGDVKQSERYDWLLASGARDYFDYSVYGKESLTENNDIFDIVKAGQSGGLVNVVFGYFRTTADSPKLLRKERNQIQYTKVSKAKMIMYTGGWRTCCFLTAANIDFSGSNPVIHFGFHDPARINPQEEESYLTQSQFYQATYEIKPTSFQVGAFDYQPGDRSRCP